MRRVITLLLLSVFLGAGDAAAGPGKVYLFPTLHRLHRENLQYSYDSLRAAIGRIRPDVIAVEIRPEDIGADTFYLGGNYPCEMWMMRYWFPDARIAGFDWLGADIAGKPIPPDYWNGTARIKKLQRELQADTALAKQIAECDESLPERTRLLRRLSLQQLIASAYNRLTQQYYDCLGSKLRASRFQYITEFYLQRDEALSRNCLAIIKANPGKRIVILTGADHYGFIKKALTEAGIRPATSW
jgi:hypothetical protein